MSTVASTRAADAHVHRLYAEYAGLPVGVVTQCVQQATTLQQMLLAACVGDTWAEKARAFHEGHEEAVFGLMQQTVDRAQRRAEHERSGLAGCLAGIGDDVLDFGGGLGFSASLLHEAGKRVTYVDVDGPVTAFARWFFERCGQSAIEVATTSCAVAELPAGRQWDLVVTERVLECVPDPVAAVESLAAVVRPGGMLLVQLQGEEAAASPLARPVAIDDLRQRAPTLGRMQHESCGDDGRHTFRAS